MRSSGGKENIEHLTTVSVCLRRRRGHGVVEDIVVDVTD
jgi:hypothetical protein